MLINFYGLLKSLTERLSLRDESGQALIEYGMLVGLIAVICIAAVGILGGTVNGFFTTINGLL
jgi:pilus assembly protein Flp/PilA